MFLNCNTLLTILTFITRFLDQKVQLKDNSILIIKFAPFPRVLITMIKLQDRAHGCRLVYHFYLSFCSSERKRKKHYETKGKESSRFLITHFGICLISWTYVSTYHYNYKHNSIIYTMATK